MITSARIHKLAALAFLAALAAPVAAQDNSRPRGPRPEVIYGADDRIDLWQVKNPKVKELADSTVALFQAGSVGAAGELSTSVYGERMSLCKEEPFWPQPMGAFCSGSLVGPDLIMTAGHCVDSESDCLNTKFVFGFGVKQEGKYPTNVGAGEVYGCKKLVGRTLQGTGADWALVQLDRTVAGHKPLKINRGPLAKGTPLFVIGHPAGLPTKVAGGASVRDETPEGYFVANLDTYGGNSGSAVFNAETGKVEGILVRGETDYVWRGGCRVSNECADDACRGEDVTKISALADQIPPTGLEESLAKSRPAIENSLKLLALPAELVGLLEKQ